MGEPQSGATHTSPGSSPRYRRAAASNSGGDVVQYLDSGLAADQQRLVRPRAPTGRAGSVLAVQLQRGDGSVRGVRGRALLPDRLATGRLRPGLGEQSTRLRRGVGYRRSSQGYGFPQEQTCW
jgi:hypothetical protein